MTNVTIIQYLLLLALLILPADSNVESSNIGQPRIGFGYLNLDTAETVNVPGRLSCSQQCAPTYTRILLNDAKADINLTRFRSRKILRTDALCRRQHDRLSL